VGKDGSREWSLGAEFIKILVSVGVLPAGAGSSDGQQILDTSFIPVLVDGIVVGGVKTDRAESIVHLSGV
jgi:hypothetical protein